MTQLVILGLDGVIMEAGIESPGGTAAPIRASLEAIASLNQAGIRVVVASTEPKIKKPGASVEHLHQVHDQIHRLLQKLGGSVEAFFFPGEPADRSTNLESCAKMYTDIADRLAVDLNLASVISTSPDELNAATASGATPVLVLTGGGLAASSHSNLPEKTVTYPDLAAAVRAILDANTPTIRSTAGRSTAGRSTAGRSTAG